MKLIKKAKTAVKIVKTEVVEVEKMRLGSRIYSESPFTDLTITTKKRTLTVARGTWLKTVEDESNGFDEFRTAIQQIKNVDTEQFVKIYTQNIKVMLGLTSAGNKVFYVLLHEVQTSKIGSDRVFLSWTRIEKKIQQMQNVDFAYHTFLRGIKNLLDKKIIACADEENWFFLNPALLFNGDRAQFILEIRRDKELDKLQKKDTKTLDMFPAIRENFF